VFFRSDEENQPTFGDEKAFIVFGMLVLRWAGGVWRNAESCNAKTVIRQRSVF
jgi:hypothetical protein